MECVLGFLVQLCGHSTVPVFYVNFSCLCIVKRHYYMKIQKSKVIYSNYLSANIG